MTAHRWEISARIADEKVLAVIRSAGPAEAVQVGRALVDGGIRVLEVAFTTPGAPEAIATLSGELGESCLVGAGTVLDESSAGAAIRAGARFLVSPNVALDVIRTAGRHGIPALPGAASLTEIVTALEAGVDMVKLFPASVLGIDYLKAILPVLPSVALLPTGGVNRETAPRWLAAGAVAVGVGGSLTRGELATVSARAAEIVKAVRPPASERG
ncbi:MAG: bifunctional 4-hydroxy-2-oxoglutarate aldolase/2-dehydro-3-deoxy-phosphogluconate aldolase [Candidatus Dormibacteraceae bacterium]